MPEPLRTAHPPSQLTMVWDGSCGFCRYWVTYWERMTGDEVRYAPYQEVAVQFPDLPEDIFKKAVRLIDSEGQVFSGIHAAYKTIALGESKSFWLTQYEKRGWFYRLSDRAYQWIADHRDFMMKLTHFAFGKDPNALKPFWFFYLMIATALVLLFL